MSAKGFCYFREKIRISSFQKKYNILYDINGGIFWPPFYGELSMCYSEKSILFMLWKSSTDITKDQLSMHGYIIALAVKCNLNMFRFYVHCKNEIAFMYIVHFILIV